MKMLVMSCKDCSLGVIGERDRKLDLVRELGEFSKEGRDIVRVVGVREGGGAGSAHNSEGVVAVDGDGVGGIAGAAQSSLLVVGVIGSGWVSGVVGVIHASDW